MMDLQVVRFRTIGNRTSFASPLPAVLCVAAVLIASGCAGPMGTMRPSESNLTPPVTSFDGSYRSTIRVTGSLGSGRDTSGWCRSPGQPIITVTNGQFTYAVPHPNVPGNATPVFPATMREDGSFYGEIIAGTISGSVRGTHIQGMIDGSACIYDFSGDRA
jgi:hypothetical protein